MTRSPSGSDGAPVVRVGLLVSIVVGIEVVFPLVAVWIDMVGVDEFAHLDISEDILELGVVMEGDGSERIKNVGIDGFSLRHVFQDLRIRSCILCLLVRLVDEHVAGEGGWVEEEVGTPTDTAESRKSVSATHICFVRSRDLFINYYYLIPQ